MVVGGGVFRCFGTFHLLKVLSWDSSGATDHTEHTWVYRHGTCMHSAGLFLPFPGAGGLPPELQARPRDAEIPRCMVCDLG